MSEIHKFLFEGLPVRGVLVRLSDAWQEILCRRSANTTHGAYPAPVQALLGEMTAAAVLLQSNIKFDGTLVMQIFGDGPVKLAVVEVQSDLGLRATATLNGLLPEAPSLREMVNVGGQGRCAITLDPQQRDSGQQAYQGVVPLAGTGDTEPVRLSEVLQHYMRQSEQLDTTLVLAANDQVAAGLLIQRLPVVGSANLASTQIALDDDPDEHFNRIALLASSLKREELLTLDADTLLHRLFWQEDLRRFELGALAPRFACSCSRERVARMLVGLGQDEANSILAQTQKIEVGCDFCGAQYRFDSVDVGQLFRQPEQRLPPGSAIH